MNKFAIPAVAAFALMAGSAAAQQQPQQQGAGQQAPQAGQHELIGMGVVDKDNVEVGEIDNVLVDQKGKIHSVILDRGTEGLLGIGGDGGGSVAIPYEQLQLPEARPGTPSDEQNAKIDMTEEQLGELPEFESTREEAEEAGEEPRMQQPGGTTGTTGTQPGQQRQ